MACPKCQSENVKKFGKNRNGSQRFRCDNCKKTFTEEQVKPLGNMRLPVADAVKCLKLLLDGMSIRAVERFMGISRNTIGALILTAGEQCERFLKTRLHNVKVTDLQIDEVWSFVGAKQKTCDRKHLGPEFGDCYTYLAMERDSKLIASYRVGKRDIDNTREFIHDLAQSVNGNFQISTDGWPAYQRYIPEAFNPQSVAFGVIQKDYRNMDKIEQRRYSPSEIVSIRKYGVMGNVNENNICTSHMERGNLTLRMTVRRWTRLTNAHSKSWRHHEAAMSLFIAFYNFCRVHSTLKTTPAVAHGVTGKTWTLEELLLVSSAA